MPFFPNATNRDLVTGGTALLLLSNLAFAAALAPAPRLLLVAGAVLVGGLALRSAPPRPGGTLCQGVDWKALGLCSALATALLVLGGGGHLLYANWDWLWRDAVLADLSRQSFPPRYEWGGQLYILRAPTGMYMLPALAGRLGGLAVAHAALLVQNALFLTLILYGLAALAGLRRALFLAIFVTFSGLDIVGQYLMAAERGQDLAALALPSQIESWSPYFQYSSHVTQLFWVPNHCLPGWWFALLAWLCARREISLGLVGASCVASLIWSPLAMAGALPVLVCLLVLRFRETVRDPANWGYAVAAIGFLPVLLYLTDDAGTVPGRFLVRERFFAPVYGQFVLLELASGIVVLACRRHLRPEMRPLGLVAGIVLLLLPFYSLGVGNDLAMRGSIVPLALLAIAFALVVTAVLSRTVAAAAAAVVAPLGAATPAFEIGRALAFPRYRASDCSLLSVWASLDGQGYMGNYLARPDGLSRGLFGDAPGGTPPAVAERRACWPDYPFDPGLHVWNTSNARLRDPGLRSSLP